MTTLLFIDAKVPAPGLPACPSLVFYENGDWTINFTGDVDYLSSEKGFMTSHCVVGLLSEIALMYTDDEIDVDAREAYLYLDFSIEEDGDEPVVLIWTDGAMTISDREGAQRSIEEDDDLIYNFVPLSDLLHDLKAFITRHADHFEDDDEDEVMPLDFDEED